jgi:hypothetical protein
MVERPFLAVSVARPTGGGGAMNRLALFVGVMLVVACGGSNYYVIKDPSTGQSYYTTEYKNLDNGAIQLTDAKTNSTVTLPSSSIQKVDKSEYEAKLSAPAAPPAVPAPATGGAGATGVTPAPAPATTTGTPVTK